MGEFCRQTNLLNVYLCQFTVRAPIFRKENCCQMFQKKNISLEKFFNSFTSFEIKVN